MNRKALSLVLAGVLSASAVIPVFASGTSGGAVPTANGTEVWAGIVLEDIDARIKVEVPTLFAFVVNGVVGVDTAAISVDEGSLLLPNVKVKVTDPTVNNGAYQIQTVGDGVMQFTNYSTKVDSGDRVGLEVFLNGNIKNEGTPTSRNYWEHVANVATGDVETFKKYNVSIDGEFLDTPANGGLELANAIELDAPVGVESGNLDAVTKLAKTGTTKTVDFGVAVGGQRGQYKQVEESAKVGTIVWTISADIANNGSIYTAPSNNYMDENGNVAP